MDIAIYPSHCPCVCTESEVLPLQKRGVEKVKLYAEGGGAKRFHPIKGHKEGGGGQFWTFVFVNL